MRLFGAMLVAGCAAVTGCSSEPDNSDANGRRAPIVIDENAVLAPRAVSDGAIVEDGRISLPRTSKTEAWVTELRPGSVIAGDRDKSAADLALSKNPYGFLRKVTSIVDADPIVILTEPAQLPDLLEGDLVFGEGQASIFAGATDDVIVTKTLRPLADTERSTGSGKASISGELKSDVGRIVSFSEGTFDLDAEFEAELKIRKWWQIPTGLEKASAKLTLNPKASVVLEIGASVGAGGGSASASWEGLSVPIPIGGPIPLTLRLRPEVTCSVSLGGSITARGRAHLTGRTAAGFTYQDGDMRPDNEQPSLKPGFDLIGVQGKATLNGECVIQAVVSLFAFDAVGIEGKLGPYASVTAELCGAYGHDGLDGGFTVSEEHGIRADVTGRLQVPGLGSPKIEKPIFGLAGLKSPRRYFVGSESTCEAPPQKDSCEGKADGVYCSQLNESSAYECLDGQIAGGQHCDPPKKCKGPIQGSKIVCE